MLLISSVGCLEHQGLSTLFMPVWGLRHEAWCPSVLWQTLAQQSFHAREACTKRFKSKNCFLR